DRRRRWKFLDLKAQPADGHGDGGSPGLVIADHEAKRLTHVSIVAAGCEEILDRAPHSRVRFLRTNAGALSGSAPGRGDLSRRRGDHCGQGIKDGLTIARKFATPVKR